tara:strand:+ start:109 stop:672 length:564 start_codon:yes stop_codon:yes gene_type:complete
MYKTLPIFLIFFSIGVFFIIVKNLTEQNVNFNENLNKVKTAEETMNDQSKSELLKDEKLLDKDFEMKKIENISQDIIAQTQKSQIDTATKKPKNRNEINLKNNKDNQIKKKYILLQFGAFSSQERAEIMQKKIKNSINKEYENFDLYIKKSESKKIYKILFNSRNLTEANDICSYSKSINFDCYIKK